MGKKILILLPYPPGRAPSQRFRIEHFIDALKKNGHEVDLAPFLDEKAWNILYQPRHLVEKFSGFMRGFIRRYAQFLRLHRYDAVWVHRETAPIGLPLLAFLMVKVWRRKVFYEFDDAVWMPNVSYSNRYFSFLKPYRNARYLMRHSYYNIGGNEWLTDFARQYHNRAVCIPTVVDTERNHRIEQDQQTDRPVVGWTGSHSTLPYLTDMVPLLKEVYEIQKFTLLIISDLAPTFDFPEMEFVPWKKSSEVSDLLRLHIGLMPLPDEDWAKGKCGFKLIQYMSLGIVPLASAVGANLKIIDDKHNGLICNTNEDWKRALLLLLKDHDKRKALSAGCRPKVVREFSVRSQQSKFLHLFDF